MPLSAIDLTRSLCPTEKHSEVTRAWWAVVCRFLLHGLVLSSWASRIPAIQSSLRLSNAALGFCLLGTAIGSVLSIPAAGALILRRGSKSVTAWTTVALAISLIGPSFATTPLTLFVALLLLGASAGANDVAINAQAVAVEKAMRTPTMSRFHAMFSIGGMIGASTGALLAAQSISPHLHFLAAAALFILMALTTSPLLLDANDVVAGQTRRVGLRSMPSVVYTLAAIGFCLFLSEGAMIDWSAVYMKQQLGAQPGLAAAAYAIFSTGMALLRLLGDFLTGRFGPVRTLRGAAYVAILGLLLTLTARSPDLALPGFALTGAGFAVIVPLVFAASGRAFPQAPGSSIAVISGSGYIGFLLGPPLIGLLAELSSLRAALFLLVLLSGVAAFLGSAVGRVSTSFKPGSAGLPHHERAIE